MVFSLFFPLGFKELCLVYRYTLDFSHRVFQRFKTMADEYTTVPTTRLNGAYTRSIDQGGVLRLIRVN
jgi:hypothetical protein